VGQLLLWDLLNLLRLVVLQGRLHLWGLAGLASLWGQLIQLIRWHRLHLWGLAGLASLWGQLIQLIRWHRLVLADL
jgi:hypothetical protein